MYASSKNRRFIAIALLPGLAVFVLFAVVPIFWSVYYGFFEWKGIGAARFIGLANYREILHDPIFWRALKNNLILVASAIIGQIPVALVLAILLKRNRWFPRLVRSAVFLPMPEILAIRPVSPLTTAALKFITLMPERTASASLGPMPETWWTSRRKRSRSAAVMKP